MIPGIRGTLLSEYFAEHELDDRFGGQLGETGRQKAHQYLRRWWRGHALGLGPASGLRAVFDVSAVPLVRTLGFQVLDLTSIEQKRLLVASLQTTTGTAVGLIVTPWGERLDASWRDAVRQGIRLDAEWCFAVNGRALRLVDARRSYGRRFVEFDLAAALEEERVFAVFWGLLRAEAFNRLLKEILDCSALHATGVCRALRQGVVEALEELLHGLLSAGRRARRAPTLELVNDTYGESLTLVYRILFLLFAEARGLVPMWHPVYRDSYSIEALRRLIEQPRVAAGTWEALLAISRLVHAGCRAGDLRVTPFNGRLFSPSRTPLAESTEVDDGAAARALRALSTRPVRGAGRARITYRDLGVEQLGAVYETVLDYGPKLAAQGPTTRVELEPGSGRRKATGTFYTPVPLTEYLVRRTLGPLLTGAGADAILRLRVLDPAMGSGAFLVAACRYLATAYESALVAEGRCHASDITEAERTGFRRTIAQRCLFGVDVNPMAVELARLSIWLATLAADRPLTFLDHHLLAGDSLVGAALADLARQPPGRPNAGTRRSPSLPLFADSDLEDDVGTVVPVRLRLATEPADTVQAVRAKEQALAGLARSGGALARWKRLADVWCGWWFSSPGDRPPPKAFPEVAGAIVRGQSSLPPAMMDEWLRRARAIAGARRFFHWTLEFPEVFSEPDGRAATDPGFDAVITNPPWDMLREDGERPEGGDQRMLVSFARESGVYRFQSTGHPNRFQLFVERAARLCRRGGRVGLVVPWGLASDQGCRSLRRLLFDRAEIDSLVGMENVRAIFPIHRSVRFLLLTAMMDGRTERLPCRLGERDPDRLDAVPDTGSDPAHYPVVLGRSLIERISGSTLAIPDLRSAADVSLFEKLAVRFPAIAADEGWAVRFGRELNATDDRRHFTADRAGLPVVEGKQIEPFVVRLAGSRWSIRPEAARRLIDPAVSFERPRLAYRDVASATNRLTLIAAVLPEGCITTHTLFCSKTSLDREALDHLCGIFNSYVANYLVRPRVVTHVSVAIIERLPVPRLGRGDPRYSAIADCARTLSADPANRAAGARLQALVAAIYDLSGREFAHILATFPLVDARARDEAHAAFVATSRRP